jgi:hypothetical protein
MLLAWASGPGPRPKGPPGGAVGSGKQNDKSDVPFAAALKTKLLLTSFVFFYFVLFFPLFF